VEMETLKDDQRTALQTMEANHRREIRLLQEKLNTLATMNEEWQRFKSTLAEPRLQDASKQD